MSLSEPRAAVDDATAERLAKSVTRRALIQVEVNEVLREEIEAAADSFHITFTLAKDLLGEALEGWLTANQAEVYRLIKGEVILAREAELARLKEGG